LAGNRKRKKKCTSKYNNTCLIEFPNASHCHKVTATMCLQELVGLILGIEYGPYIYGM
jgi:hypothetical protein